MPAPTPPLVLPPLAKPAGSPGLRAGCSRYRAPQLDAALRSCLCQCCVHCCLALSHCCWHQWMWFQDQGQASSMSCPTQHTHTHTHTRTPLACPAAPVAAAPASPPGGEPDTHFGTSSFSRGQQGSSSSSGAAARGSSRSSGGKEAAPTCGAECSDAEPLLAAGSGRLAPGLRRRQGHQDGG